MATYVLVHGAWHGGWCWHRIVARLQRASHRVMAPDLLSLGIDGTPPGLVTLRAWTDQIAAVAESAATTRYRDEPNAANATSGSSSV